MEYFISTNVTVKSYSYHMSQSGFTFDYKGSWDSNGLAQSLYYMESDSGGRTSIEKIDRASAASVPSYDPLIFLLASVIGIISVIGIALKKMVK